MNLSSMNLSSLLNSCKTCSIHHVAGRHHSLSACCEKNYFLLFVLNLPPASLIWCPLHLGHNCESWSLAPLPLPSHTESYRPPRYCSLVTLLPRLKDPSLLTCFLPRRKPFHTFGLCPSLNLVQLYLCEVGTCQHCMFRTYVAHEVINCSYDVLFHS